VRAVETWQRWDAVAALVPVERISSVVNDGLLDPANGNKGKWKEEDTKLVEL
jgi:hypothetical protein